jgi:hypothetical protein
MYRVDRRQKESFVGRFQREKATTSKQVFFSRVIQSFHHIHSISPLLPSDFLPPRATVNRIIAMLPSYNSIPHFDTKNPTRAAFRHALGTKRFQFPSLAGRMEEDEEASRLGE